MKLVRVGVGAVRRGAVGKTALLEYLVRRFDPDCAIETAGQGPDHVFPAPRLQDS
jgi:hypothetical protein